ncbi:MAG: YbaK/EbsC family protein [Chloroflexota bacterium]|nr:YbaK/EbsC family protein [Chloroflexota bacterium]MDE3194538.1 YbaK/EbsC family protein [Chloroflexota bacterium]
MRAHAETAGARIEIRRYPAGTHTAQDAAAAIGCDAAQIVKSLVFLAAGDPVVVLVSGSDRVDESKLAAVLGASSVRRATANEARDASGFVVGGVPPFGHTTPLPVVVDSALLRHDEVWAAAGLPDAVFPISPADLVRLARATEADVRV